MTETTNSYSRNTASVTLQALNLLPNPNEPGHLSYQDVDPAALGKASPQIRIAITGIGGAPVSGDFSQGLPKDQAFGIAADVHTTVLVDTGSFNSVLPRSLFAGILSDDELARYPAATVSYSSDDNTGTGVWVPMEITMTATDGTKVVSKVPVVVQLTGKTDYMMGVGFNIGRGIAGSMPDTSTYANAFLNLEPTAGGTLSRGYLIDGTGIHLGLTAASVGSGWALQKLQASPRSVPDGAPPDWQAATVSGTLDNPATGTAAATSTTISPAGLLMDTGVTKTFIKTHDGLPAPAEGATVSLDLFGTGGQVGYRYVLGGASPQQPTTEKGSAAVTGTPDPGRPNLLNTGVHFLSGFDYLYDAENGYVGVRGNAAATRDDLSVTPLVAVSGSYPMPDGFAAAAPLFVSGDSQISVSGTATLSGGVQGPGTLTLAGGTLVLSGSSATASLLLQPGTVLRAPASLVLARLDANGAATLEVPGGATVQAATGLVPPPGGLGYGVLSVTGGGTLSVGGLSVASGHSVLAGGIAGLNGATIPGFMPGDLIEVVGTDARMVAVTARYDAASRTLAITAGTQTASVHLVAAPPAATSFTVRTDSNGGSLVQLTTPSGKGASDALNATALRAAGGPDGSGVIVGVISISNNTLGGMAQDIANGDLPADTQVLNDPAGASTDEGRAMAQLIHSIAPGAAIRMYSATGLDNGQDIATAIDALLAKGARVIVDDLSVLSDRMYQAGGPVADAIARATAQGVVLVTSAGDSGTNYYEHALSLEQTTLPGIAGTVQAFRFGQGANPYLERLDLKPTGQGNVQLTLGWTQPGQSPAYQLRMAIFRENADGSYTRTGDVPYAQVTGNGATISMPVADSSDGGTFFVAVYGMAPVAAADQVFKLTVHHEGNSHVFSDPNANKGSGSIYGHALDPNEITAGAVYYGDAGAPVPQPEVFSTPGTGGYLLDAAGNREAVALSKPDVSGVDGVHNDVSGVDSSFYGTSASAPTVAAVAALMLQANPNLSPADVKTMMAASARPTGSMLQGGAGLVQADKAVALARLTNGGSATVDGTGKTIAVAAGGTLTTGTGGNTVNIGDTGTVLSHGPDRINGGTGAGAVSLLGQGGTVVGGAGTLTVTGGAGGNTVFAGTGGLSYRGGTGFDTVVGLGKPMAAVGGTGGGEFFGGGGSTITAGAGGDRNVVVGGNGDRLYASGPKGVLFGTTGGDVLMSSATDAGNSVFFGANGTGRMTFVTGAGNDLLALGQGTNDVTLGSGHAVIFGNGGRSAVSAITAGSGSLDLAFSGASTVLTIAAGEARTFNLFSFGQGQESIRLRGYGANEAADALATQRSLGGGTQLSLSDGSVISLVGVERATTGLFA